MFVNMELYRPFYYTAKTGSISKAAQQLFISQPAISHSIKQLETKLQGQLFFRTAKGVTLTAEGEVLFTYIDQAYNLIMTAERRIGEMQNLMSGEIKIGASDTLCKHYLLQHLGAFHQQFPDVRIQVTNRTTPETVKLLKDGRIDLGVVNLPIDDKQLIVREGMVIQDCFVAGEKFRALTEEVLSLSELMNYPVILLERGSNTRVYLERYFHALDVPITPEIELGSIDLLVQFAQIGLGIACVIKNFVQTELEQKTLYELKLKEKIPARRIGIVTLKAVPLSVAAKKFIRLLGYD